MACSPPDHRHVQHHRQRDREESLPHGRRHPLRHATGLKPGKSGADGPPATAPRSATLSLGPPRRNSPLVEQGGRAFHTEWPTKLRRFPPDPSQFRWHFPTSRWPTKLRQDTTGSASQITSTGTLVCLLSRAYTGRVSFGLNNIGTSHGSALGRPRPAERRTPCLCAVSRIDILCPLRARNPEGAEAPMNPAIIMLGMGWRLRPGPIAAHSPPGKNRGMKETPMKETIKRRKQVLGRMDGHETILSIGNWCCVDLCSHVCTQFWCCSGYGRTVHGCPCRR
jgi:hypothetical protein